MVKLFIEWVREQLRIHFIIKLSLNFKIRAFETSFRMFITTQDQKNKEWRKSHGYYYPRPYDQGSYNISIVKEEKTRL